MDRWDSLPSRVELQTERLLELLSRHGHTGTFFVLGWIAERHPKFVRSIADAGHEVASHGYAHRLVYDLGPNAFREDIRRSKAAVEDACGAQVRGHRAASFSITPRSLWAFDILAEEGFEYDSSVYPVRHHRYGIPDSALGAHRRDGITEVPIATLQVGPLRIGVGGGAYMRFLPEPVWLRAISRVAQERPLTLYVHPWECEPDQPRLDGSPIARLRQYGALGPTLNKLDAVFGRFRFGTFADLATHGQRG
jgi:polysaccharide deacetylase family protein (PEP-CTERM system associated)